MQEEIPIDPAPQLGPGMSSGSRVCDKCLVQKRKCNRQRPKCSRCADDNIQCVYSSAKRKPGPAKGSRRQKAFRVDTVVPQTEESGQQHVSSHEFAAQSFTPLVTSVDVTEEVLPYQVSDHTGSIMANSSYSVGSVGPEYSQLSPMDPRLQPEHVYQSLDSFFTYVNPSLSLFDKDIFISKYEHGLINRDLLLTILAISAHIQGLSSLWTKPSLRSCLNQLLATRSFDLENPGDAKLLSRFQQACLLAFYEFHQYPGHKAWLRISELTREAYRCGLHQIDNQAECPLYGSNFMTTEENGEWRRLWWCIYCLDSYCNITASTPFVIELDSVRTALIPDVYSADHNYDLGDLIFLPADTANLWKSSKAVSRSSGNSHVNVHIVTTTILREAGKLLRIWKQNPTAQTNSKITALDDHLSAVRLALPLSYMDVSRSIRMNESQAEHHARLICILHLHAARLLISLPRTFEDGELQWRHFWQTTLECCDDVVSTVKQWKAQLCLSVDPAVCFIISGALSVLHLHSIDVVNSGASDFLARLQMQKDLLRLFLEQFASIWHLPQFLLASFQKFSLLFPHNLAAQEIADVLSQMRGSLDQGWMRFLSLTSDDLKPPELPEFYLNLMSEADFSDWETWANATDMTFRL